MILYNGSTGSLGAYLQTAPAPSGVAKLALRSRLEDRTGLREELAALRPQVRTAGQLVFCHLAAKVSVPACEREPEAAWRTNVADAVETVRDVAQWAYDCGKTLKVVYVSSGHVYAEQPAGTRLGEDRPLAPRSVYARTKLECEGRLGELASEAGLRLVVARVFGLIAPRQPANYVLPGLIRRVRHAELQGIPGLSFVRDYLDARDVCESLVQLGLSGDTVSGVINVCSGEPTPLRELLAGIAHYLRPHAADQLLEGASEAPARPDDIRWIVGDPTRLISLTGRSPRRIPISRTIAEAVDASAEDRR